MSPAPMTYTAGCSCGSCGKFFPRTPSGWTLGWQLGPASSWKCPMCSGPRLAASNQLTQTEAHNRRPGFNNLSGVGL